MAIRASIYMRALGLCAACVAAATLGCVAAPDSQAQGPSPAYRAPADIKPAESSIKPAPVSAAPVYEVPAHVSVSPHAPASAWIPQARQRSWKYIVIHHSATPNGNAAKFDREHKAKGWDELGYHFVIDNGYGGPDGRVEVGPRWPKQKWGAHAKTPDNRYNELGIGICFVGNFQDGKPTAKQMQSAARLVAWLMQTYKIPASNIIGHDDTKSTLCPGKNMNLARVRSLANDEIAGVSIDDEDLSPAQTRVAVDDTERELLKSR